MGDNAENEGGKRKEAEVSDVSPKMLPLHRRRFDAKQRVFPSELIALPNTSISVRPTSISSRKFCEDLTERLQKKDDNALEELQPLYARSAHIAAATLATEDAFDHLDKLYVLMEQLLTLKEQNSKIQRRVRDMEHIKKLQEMHQQIEKEMMRTKTLDPDSFYKSEATSMDLGEEYEYTEALLDSMLEAGRNASLKRAKWKSPSRSKLRQSIVRSQRSRSMGGEELEACAVPDSEYSCHLTVPYKGKRGLEEKSGDKSKISKWTRVKAAFKWEKAHTGIVGDSVSALPQRAFIPPSSFVPLTPGTPLTPVATPASITPASSAEDVTENVACRHDSTRRSRSLDSSVILDPISGQLNNEDICNTSSTKLHKTPWGKMKDIIQTRKESVRKKQNRNSIRSSSGCRTSENYSLSDGGGLSQSESAEILCASDKNSPKRKISGQERGDISISELSDTTRRTTPTLTVTMPSSEELAKNHRAVSSTEASTSSSPHQMSKSMSQPRVEIKHDGQHRVLTKQKSLELSKRVAVRPNTLQDSSDADTASPIIHRHDSKWKKVKKAFLTSTSASTPSSPSRNSAFFSYEPEDIQNDIRSSRVGLEEEIKRDYEALQSRLSKEFYEKVVEWSSGGTGSGAGNSPSGSHSPSQNFVKKMDEWEKMKLSSGSVRQPCSGPPTPGEDRLSADFRKKLHEWHKTKGNATNQSPSPIVPSSTIPSIPTHAQLSEDFRKKLEEWKRLKATNSVPSYTGDDSDRPPRDHERDERISKLKKAVGQQKKEVLVQTGAGFFRFEGISRSFTRKLHEWEKSRGIGPEASTIALLRESLAKPPLPITRTTGYGPWPSGYQKNDRGPMRLQRSQSVGSVRDDAVPHVSASVSSLSLTHLDECANNNENRGSDVGEDCYDASLDVESRPLGTESDSDGGPGAVLVEVEDEVEETAAPLVACSPCAAPQTPVYRYGQAQERHRACESTDGKLTPVAYAISMPPHPWTNCLHELQGNITQLMKEEDTIQKLIIGRQNVIERRADVSKRIEDVKGQSSTTSAKVVEFKRRLSRLEKEKDLLHTSIKERIIGFNEMVLKICSGVKELKLEDEKIAKSLFEMLGVFSMKIEYLNQRSVERYISTKKDNMHGGDTLIEQLKDIYAYIEELKLECTKSNVNNKENNLCITYTASKPKLREAVIKTDVANELLGVESEANESFNRSIDVKCEDFSEMSCKPISSPEDITGDSTKGARRKVKDNQDKVNANNSKRKSKIRQRLEREKSLQSESDSEKEVNTVTIEFPRRKKPVKSKSMPESHSISKQNSFEKQSNTDSGDNVFILTLKPKSLNGQSFPSEKDSTIQELNEKKIVTMKKSSLDSTSDFKPNDLSEKTDSVEILISPKQLPIDIPPEGIEFQTEVNNNPDIFVKTTRKIFSPVRRDSKGETKAVIGFDLEEIANSFGKVDVENNRKIADLQENLPDILVNNEIKRKCSDSTELNRSKIEELKRELNTCDSMNSVRSHSPSPLLLKRSLSSNNAGNRNLSDESISQSKDIPPIRRGSGERFIGCKGSPVLSRASTPGVMGSSLPPLPASPPTNRRDKSKETAPSIRIMIQKYNMKLNEEGSDIKSPGGNSTPPWRSPRSQERFPHDGSRRTVQQSVRNNPFFNREVQKSASASQIMKQSSQVDVDSKYNYRRMYSKENVSDGPEMTPPLPKKMLRGILKSSSAGSLKTTSPLCQRKDYLMKCENERNTMPGESHVKNEEMKQNVEYINQMGDIPKSIVPTNDNIGDDNNNNDNDNKNDNFVSDNNDSSSLSRVQNMEGSLDGSRDAINFYGKKIDVDLLRLAKSSTCIPIEQFESDYNYVLPEATCSRAIKLKRAKEKFLALDLKHDDVTKREERTNRKDDSIGNRLSQISCGSDTSYEGNSLSTASNTPTSYQDSLLMKSASVGMINVEKQAYDKLNSQKGYESLPRNQTSSSVDKEISKSGSRFGLSNLASKFRKVRMRSKNKTEKNSEKERLDTVTKLCRQSLLVNLHGSTPIEPERRSSDVKIKTERSHSQTDKSIFLAGKTGGAIAVNNEEFYSQFERSISRSSSKSDNDPGCSKNYK